MSVLFVLFVVVGFFGCWFIVVGFCFVFFFVVVKITNNVRCVLSLRVYIYLFITKHIYPSNYLPTYLRTYIFTYLRIFVSAYLPDIPFTYVTTYLPVILGLSCTY